MDCTQKPPEIPQLQRFDAVSFREKLAGQACAEAESPECAAEYASQAEAIGILLAKHFSDSLDRLTLWKRIGSAVLGACAKAPGGEPSLLLSAMLEHVKADAAAVSRDRVFVDILADMDAKPQSWREGFVVHLKTTIYAVLVRMRRAWSAHKGKDAD